MTEEIIRQLIDFVAKYGDECTPQQVKLLHRVLNRLELKADDERKKRESGLPCPLLRCRIRIV